MVNLGSNEIVFNASSVELASAVQRSLALAASRSLIVCGLEGINLATVTTKTNLRAAFAKFVNGRVLGRPSSYFDQAYVNCAFEAYRQRTGHFTKEHFLLLMAADETGPYSYKASYAIAVRSGLGTFLVALHSTGAITLSGTFRWPAVREGRDGKGKRLEVGRYVASELLAFIRTLDSQAETLPHPAFEAIGGDRKRREWFLTYASKLLLASGWHRPEDANLDDLLSIKEAEKAISGKESMPLAYGALLDVLNKAFPGRIKITSAAWSDALRTRFANTVRTNGQSTTVSKALQHVFQDGPRSDRDLLEDVLQLTAAWGKPERVRPIERLPGLDIDIKALSKLWIELQELYIRKTPRENYRGVYGALGWWNIYLFFYLPYWFRRNHGTKLTYPSSPSLLLKTVFVSRLLTSNEEMPVTFVEFMSAQAERRGWTGNGHYAILLQLQRFFEFVERYSDEMPGCEGFTQPFSPHDFPRTSRSRATKKQPVPRRFFGIYLDYHEALIAHLNVVLHKVLEGELTTEQAKSLEANGGVIDTFATSELVGFIPVIFTKSKTLALQFIPNVLDMRLRIVRGSRARNVPHPHCLHQNLVALHTGVRHNHIQWLDKDRFDSLVDEADAEFTLLFVNTDKQKNEPWTPHVSYRVIEILRAQREWCDLIEEPGFHSEHFYNDNPATKWPKFEPLFAYSVKGKPHTDAKYTDVWRAVLCGLQGLMPELPEFGRSRRLLKLLPPGHKHDDNDLADKLAEYGSQFRMGECCPLRVTSPITPHSARVAVVSQYITFLPTDLIGKYITGQKEGVVPYYVHLDQEAVDAERVHQAARMRTEALRSAFEPVLHGRESSATFVHADSINSNLARSMKANLEETISAYGGMCISFNDEAARGLDVLRESGGVDVAFNKTEVCPYGNNCPPDVVKELKGLRRCGLCPYAVRFIDHLPAIVARKRQIAESVDELESVLSMEAKTLNAKYTPEELDSMEAERTRLCEDLSGWTLCEEVLEVMRHRISAGQERRTWTVRRPEVIERDLRRVAVHTTASEYLLARLGECIAFPSLESPQVRARFDLLRRELLARAGNLRAAFASSVSVDPAAECAGLLRSVVAASGLTVPRLAQLLEHDQHITGLPMASLRLLATEEAT